MKLRDVDILPAYSTDDGRDLLSSFYNPVLECAVKYDRVTGFFSPRVFAIAARGFRKCVENNCKIRIITSVCVEDETYEAINEATRLKDISSAVSDFNSDSLRTELDYDYLQLFMYLYSTGQLELRIAAIRAGDGIFHEKVGIITDSDGDSISFSGSNNETASGWINNIEEFKVFKDWEPVQSTYCNIDKQKFDNYWNNLNKRFKVLSLDEAESQELIRKTLEPDLTIEEIKKRIYQREGGVVIGEPDPEPSGKRLRKYQEDAIEHWVNSGYKTVFEMATGTGKTFTTVNALKQFRDHKGRIHCVIGVPLISLLIQWNGELAALFGNGVKTVIASSSVDKGWKNSFDELIVKARMGICPDFAILVPYITLSSDDFIEKLKKLQLDDLVFLADEMHNLVTERAMSLLSDDLFPYRLGLSATPVRLWAPEESASAMAFFGNDPYRFTLEKAIKEEFLVPFNYYVYPVYLTVDEFDEYCNISHEVGRFSAMGDGYKKAAESALLRRARIKKNAENKVLALDAALEWNKNKGMAERALLYADNTDMLEAVQAVLLRHNLISSRFTGTEAIDIRQEITNALRNREIDAIVAMKCLDEGVDIPSARNAYFVSSNTDPREYIQRLGRVLRRDDESGKTHANVFDFIVLPPSGYYYENETQREIGRNLVRNEIIRAKFFYELANNSEEAKEVVGDIVGGMGMTFTEEELNINNSQEGYGIK